MNVGRSSEGIRRVLGRCARVLAVPWRAVVVAWLLAAGTHVQAQNPSLGASLYTSTVVPGEKSCSNAACHGTRFDFDTNLIRSAATAESIQTAVGNVADMRFLDGRLTALDFNDLAAYVARETGQTPFFLPAPGAAAALAAASNAVDFGAVLVGTQRTQTLLLTNVGRAPLRLDSVTASDPAFALSHDCVPQVAIDSRCTLTLTYSPVGVGASNAQATLASNDPAGPAVLALSGSGSNSAVAVLQWVGNPVAFTLPTTALGRVSAAQVVSLRNVGTVPATLDDVTVIGGNAASFPLSGGCVGGLVLAAGADCEVAVTFAPTEVGAPAAQLRVQARDAGLPPVVLLSGTAVAADTGSAAATTDQNVGGGGCTAGSHETLFDPIWMLLLVGAGVVGWRRRRQRQQQGTHGEDGDADLAG